jgi:hypothetical protein
MPIDSFDAKALIDICERPPETFSDYAERYDLAPALITFGKDKGKGKYRDRFYHYADHGSDVLAVAHLDTVMDDRSCHVIDAAGGLLAVSGALDDRLGAYVILELLPRLGVNLDVLLTTDEELAATTASDFFPDKEYNWIIEFDRGGTDVVMYDYETSDLVDLVEDSGAVVGIGSYSDICALEHLECSAFNWGVGYEDYHGPRSHAWLEDTFESVENFLRFYDRNADRYLLHRPYGHTPALTDDEKELQEWFRERYDR